MTIIKISISRIDPAATPFVAMALPVLAAAWLGGWGPGLLATGLCLLAGLYLIPTDVDNLSPVNGVVFVIEGILISWLADQRRTARSRGRLTREQLRLLHDGIDDSALIMLRSDGTIDDWNERAQSMFGYTPAEVIGKPIRMLYETSEQDAHASEEHLQQARNRGRVDVSGWRIRRDESPFWADVQLTALRNHDAQVHGFAHVITDRSDRKQTEQELQEYRTRLEEIVAERTRALHDSMSRLRMSERMASLGTLSAGLGHDMGNLLLPIRLRLDAIQAKGVPEILREDLASIATCADYLQRLSNGLRLLSIDPAQANAAPASTDLTDWWADVQPFLRNALPKHIELEKRIADHLPPAAAPRHLLTQAVFNLVQNAGHSIPAERAGRVIVWAESGVEAGTLQLGVTDNGMGMSDDVRSRCLEPFYTSKIRAISTGLGLTLVHAMVQQVGGRIDITSTVGKGTTIALTLPIIRAAGESHGREGRPLVRAVVDIADNRMRTYLGAVMRSVGFEVAYGRTVENGAQVCVTDANTRIADIDQFLQSDPQPRKCVILGRNSDTRLPPEVVQLGDHPAPGVLRDVLLKLASEFDASADKGRHDD